MRIFSYIVVNDNCFFFKFPKKQQVKTRIKETGKYVFLCLLVGIIVDVFVKNGYHWLTVENLDNYCLGLIQIQATMTTLIISTIALLSGILTKSYLGISLCFFVLEVKPEVLKFKNILINEFVLLGLTIILYIFKCYNSVIVLCAYSIFILPFFIKNVYYAFVNTSDIFCEIRKHYLYLVKEDKNYKYIGEQFIKDWKKAIVIKQSKEEYKDYFRLFMDLIKRILSKENDFKTINAFSEVMANFLLTSENYETKLKGVIFIFDFYKEINKWLNDNFNTANNIRGQVTLLSDVFRTWWVVIDSLSTEDIEKLGFRALLKNVLETAVILGAKENDNVPDLEKLQNMAELFGFLLDKQYKKGYSVNIHYWRTLIVNIHLEYACCNKSLYKDSKEVYYKSWARINFNICKSYLTRGYTDYINSALFSDLSGYITNLEYNQDGREAIILEMMLIHCFMYYLAFRECSPHITEELQMNVRNLIEDKNVINKIHDFYYKVALNHSSCLSVSLEQNLENILDQCELFNFDEEGGGTKILTMEGVVRDYYLYIVLWVRINTLNKFNWSEYLEFDKYYPYMFNSARETIKDHLCKLNSLFNENPLAFQIDSMLNIFDREMKNELKIKKISEAALKYKEFDICNVKEKIQNALKSYFHSFFDENNSNCISPKGTKKLFLVQVIAPVLTEILTGDVPSVYMELMFSNFNKEFITTLVKTLGVEQKKLNNESTNFLEIIKYIQDKKYDLFLGGSDWLLYSAILESQKTEEKDQYQNSINFIKNMNRIQVPYSDYIFATNTGEFSVCLEGIDVDINSQSLNNMNSNEYARKGNMISYCYSNQLTLDFTEDEFNQFIGYYMQNVHIT